jgi:hypothetical protein
LYNIKERVSVCDRCYKDLLLENNWLQNHLPLLLGGGTFKHAYPLGLGVRKVELRLLEDGKTLEFVPMDDDGHGKATKVLLQHVEQVSTPGADQICLHVEKKTFIFECVDFDEDKDSAVVDQGRWVRALKAAVMKSHQRCAPFRETVLKERAEKLMRWEKKRAAQVTPAVHVDV